MKHLWAPWRRAYVENPEQEPGCLFCTRAAQPDGPDSLIVQRARHAFVILNRYPYTSGHLMVVPFAHVASLELLSEEALDDLMRLAARSLTALRRAFQAPAFNLGANIGEAAGAGVADHVHLHVVPRWPGDTNFMTTTADVRVIPIALEDAYNRLRAAWEAPSGNG